MRRPLRLLVSVLLTILAPLALTACGDDDDGDAWPDPPDPTERLVEIYAVTIEAIASDAGPLPTEDDDPLTVYVAERDDADISADVQVGVVSALEDWATVRFIDSIDEAIDPGAEGEPVRGEGILVGLGPVSDGEVRATLTADRYVSPETTRVFDVSVVRHAGNWTVEEPLTAVTVSSP